MTIKSKKFKKGVRTEPTTSPATEEGEIRNDSADNKQKVFTEGAEREIVTNNQTQTLENKTIDSASNTVTVDADTAAVSNLEVDNLKAGVLETDLNNAVDDTNLPSAKSVKDYVAQEVATKDEASEISYDNVASGLTAANVQAAVDEVEGRLDTAEADVTTAQSTADNHIADALDAHAASAITNTPSGNLAATDVQSALNEIQTEVDSVSSAASGAQSSINDHIADIADAHDASAISNVPAGNLAATDVQGALDELQTDVDSRALASDLTDHLNDITDAHDASAISNVPAGNLAATDVQSALDELQTDVDTRALDADLTAHTGATSGVHGVTGDVVGTTDTQTLTNKTIDGATITSPAQLDVKKDTRANLEVYATTATNGQFVFATDTKEMLQVVDTELVSVGGSGVGGVDIFHVERFEQTEAADASTGNNATFLGGGTLAGTLVDEEVSPLKGDRSFKYTQAVGSATDYVALPSVVIDEKEQGNLASVSVYTTYDGNDNEIDFIVYDATGTTVLASVPIRASSKALKHEAIVNLPDTIASLRYGIQTVIENSGAVLIIDEVEAKLNPLTPTDIYASSEWVNAGAVTIEGTTSNPTKGAVAEDSIFWRRIGDSMEIRVEYEQTSAGSAGSGDYLINIPSGYQIDLDKLARASGAANDMRGAVVGTSLVGNTNAEASATVDPGPVVVYDSTRVRFFLDVSNTITPWQSTTQQLSGTTVNASAIFTVPIAGWSNTSQGVVVKNRTDSASVENVFSARIANNGTATVTSQSVDFIESVSRSAAGIIDVTFSSGLFSQVPQCAVTIDSLTSADIAGIVTISSSSLQTYTKNTSNTNLDEDINLICQRQGTDYIKETDKVYTVDVANLRGNWVRAEGNGGTSITANVTDIDFTEVTDSAGAWDGDSYTVQENNSVVKLSGTSLANASYTGTLSLYKNGSSYKNLSENLTIDQRKFDFISSRGEFASGDVLSIRSSANITLSNSTAFHYLNIVEEYPQEGVYLGTFGQPTCYYSVDASTYYTFYAATTAYKVSPILGHDTGSCGFSSVASNQIALQAGTYQYDIPVGSDNNNGQIDARIANVTDSSIIKEFIGVLSSSTLSHKYNRIRGQFSLNSPKTIQIETKAAGTGGNELIAGFSITKVR